MKKIKDKYLRRRQNRKSESTYRTDKIAISKIQKYLDEEDIKWYNINYFGADDFLDWLTTNENLSEMSAYNYFGSVRTYYDYLVKIEKGKAKNVTENPFRDVDTGHINWDQRVSKKPTLNEMEIRELIKCFDKARSKAIFSFQASTGARIGEVVKTKIKNVNLKKRKAIIPTFKNPKRDKRTVYFDRKTRSILRKYINDGYRDKYAGQDTEYLFLSGEYGQYDNDGHISKDVARRKFVKAVKDCENIQDKVSYEETADGKMICSVTTHILRRSFCQNWVDSGGDLMSLKNHVGWESLETAKQYLSDEVDKEKRDRYGVKI